MVYTGWYRKKGSCGRKKNAQNFIKFHNTQVVAGFRTGLTRFYGFQLENVQRLSVTAQYKCCNIIPDSM